MVRRVHTASCLLRSSPGIPPKNRPKNERPSSSSSSSVAAALEDELEDELQRDRYNVRRNRYNVQPPTRLAVRLAAWPSSHGTERHGGVALADRYIMQRDHRNIP